VTKRSPFRCFKASPEIICLAGMMYVRFPLSLRDVEDLLHEGGIDISHQTVRFWWNRFGSIFCSFAPPRQQNQQRHAHVYERNGRQSCIVNGDGTGSHGRDAKKSGNRKPMKFLSSRGFNVLGLYLTYVLYCLPSVEEMNCQLNPLLCNRPSI